MGTITEQDLGNGVVEITETPGRNSGNGGSNIELESPMSPATLASRIAKLEGNLAFLRKQLFGDEEAEALYAENRRTFVTPNIPKPPPGQLHAIGTRISTLEGALEQGLRGLLARSEETEKQVGRLRAFFDPILRDKNPPLDGAMIVSRRELDDSLTRIATAIRSEVAGAIKFTQDVAYNFGAVDKSRPSDVNPIEWQERLLSLRIVHTIDKLNAMWQFVAEETQRRAKGTTLERARKLIGSVIAGEKK